MLSMLAIVPLAGLVMLTVGRLNEFRTTNQQLSRLDRATTELVQLIELEAALQDEGFWSGTELGAIESGFPLELVEIVLGVDPAEQAALARAETDDRVAATDLPGLTLAVDRARATPPVLNGEPQPQDIVAQTVVAEALRAEAADVVTLAAAQPDGAELVSLARILEQANDLRSGFADVRTAFYARFDLFDDTEPLQARPLTEQLAIYDDRLETLQALAPASQALEEPLALLVADPDRTHVMSEVEASVAESTASDAGQELPAFRSIAATFATTEAAATRHLEFVAEAADALQTEMGAVRAGAERTAWLFGALTAAISVLTVGAILAATRWIVRPLIHLGRTAHALTEGGPRSLLPPSGPTEIRLIHDALTEAIVNLERTEQQAIALAAGELDDPSLSRPVPGRFGATLHAAIEQLRSSIGNQEQFSERLAYEASHDPLTGVLNRRASLDVLRQALDPTEHDGTDTQAGLATVFFVDLDHFKAVNDTLGHAAGDNVLRTVADALRTNARPGDKVGRIGGDEYLVISTSLTTPEQATRLAERFLTVVRQSIGATGALMGASIGVAIGHPGRDVDALMAEADVAMLEAKKRGRNAVCFFDEELRDRTVDELHLATEVRAGLADGEFELYYQPIVDSISGRVQHYEALIRWFRPDRGLVPPDEYIPFAERSDLVLEIDRWVMATAVDTIASGALDGIGVAVNISSRHLATGDLFDDLTSVLDRRAIDPSSLTIELTESALLGDIHGAIETLRRIRETGVKVAIDDFGTGFTSLTHLRSLPADVLKIDQSFTTNLDNSDDANLIRLIIQTAHILGLDVVVEGVETLHQAQRVTMLGADQMQGYLFAKPLPLDEIERGPSGEPIRTSRTASPR